MSEKIRKKPPGLRLLEGNRSRTPIDTLPSPRRGLTKPPDELSDVAKAEYQRLGQELLDEGLVAVIDSTMLAVYAEAYAAWLEAVGHLNSEGAVIMGEKGPRPNPWSAIRNQSRAAMKQALTELGSTPASRSKVSKLDDTNETNDPWSGEL